MQTKLTLRVDEELVKRAKSHGQRTGKSVSQLVADYFRLLEVPDVAARPAPPAPLVESLRGILKDVGVDESDYRRRLDEKYG